MKTRVTSAILLVAAVCAGQGRTGEVLISLTDASGSPVRARGELQGQSSNFALTFETDSNGQYIARPLPYGAYRLVASREGFRPIASELNVHSAVRQEVRLQFEIAPSSTMLEVKDATVRVDASHPGSAHLAGSELLTNRPQAIPGRDLLEVVQRQPGWLLEANGVLHPRGAEYDTQIVVDGIPLLDNRSPIYAPPLEVTAMQSVNVLTSGYPAEYGRKLGGVVEVTSSRPSEQGFRGQASIQGGSFETVAGNLGASYLRGRTYVSAGANVGFTDRYLDAPTLENFSNHGDLLGGVISAERDFSDTQRLRVSLQHRRTRFLVPNEREQEEAGQRQDRGNTETLGQLYFQQIFSPRLLGSVRAMFRDLDAQLWSNPLSTPIEAAQDRLLHDGYLQLHLAGNNGAHDWKIGGEGNLSTIQETFAYRIRNAARFDDETPPSFAFRDRSKGRELGLFAQDQIRWGRFVFSVGGRFDRYSLVVKDSAFSPRLGVAWHNPELGLVLRASYDRMFQTPAVENILLSSAEAARELSDEASYIPLKPSRGNQWELGFSKTFGERIRWSGAWFHRAFRNFADDDLLLNTGVSFPIAFDRARIRGYESKLEIPRWGRLSGYVSYAWLLGKAQFPVAGGLFLEDEANLASKLSFPITQDQRNTATARFRYDLMKRIWTAAGFTYGSGLPVEMEDDIDVDELQEQYGREVLNRVNLERGRVRPNFTLDLTAGATLLQRERATVRLQIDGRNLTDRVNVINFAGLFSGTAIAPPRSISARLAFTF